MASGVLSPEAPPPVVRVKRKKQSRLSDVVDDSLGTQDVLNATTSEIPNDEGSASTTSEKGEHQGVDTCRSKRGGDDASSVFDGGDVGFVGSDVSPSVAATDVGSRSIGGYEYVPRGSSAPSTRLESFVVRSFERRPLSVESIAFSQGGEFAAVGREEAQIEILDVATWSLLMVLPGEERSSARCIVWVPKIKGEHEEQEDVLSHDNALSRYRLLSAGLHGDITEWDLASGEKRCTVNSNGGAVFGTALSPSKRLLATGCDDGSVRLFCLEERESGLSSDNSLYLSKTLARHTSRLLSVCFLNDKVVFAGTSNSLILRWNVLTGRSDGKITVERHLRNTRKPVPLPVVPVKDKKEKGVFAEDEEEESRLEEIIALEAHQQKRGDTGIEAVDTNVWSLAASEKGGFLVSGDSLGHVTIWDTTSLTSLAVFKQHQADVLAVAFSVDERTLLSTGTDRRVNFYTQAQNTGDWTAVGGLYPHTSDATCMAVQGGGLAAAGSSDGSLAVFRTLWDLKHLTTRPLYIPPIIHSRWVHTAESECLALFQELAALQLWYFMPVQHDAVSISQRLSQLLSKKSDKDEGVGVDSHLLGGLSVEDVKLWISTGLPPVQPIKVATLKLRPRGGEGRDHIVASALCPNGKLVAASDRHGVRLFAFDLEELDISDVDCGSISSRAATSLVFLSSEPRPLLLCGMKTSKSVVKKKGGRPFCVVVWDVEARKVVEEIACFDTPITSLEVSRDRQWLAARDVQGCVVVVNLDSFVIHWRMPTFSTTSLGGRATAAVFSPSCDAIAVCSSASTFIIGDLSSKQLLPIPTETNTRSRKSRGGEETKGENGERIKRRREKKDDSEDEGDDRDVLGLISKLRPSCGHISRVVWMTCASSSSSFDGSRGEVGGGMALLCQTSAALCSIRLPPLSSLRARRRRRTKRRRPEVEQPRSSESEDSSSSDSYVPMRVKLDRSNPRYLCVERVSRSVWSRCMTAKSQSKGGNVASPPSTARNKDAEEGGSSADRAESTPSADDLLLVFAPPRLAAVAAAPPPFNRRRFGT